MEGMEKGPFDDQKRNQQGDIDFIIARFFTRLLLGPDPIVGILDTLTNENGKWITPIKTTPGLLTILLKFQDFQIWL